FVTSLCFFFNDTATTEIYSLSLHDALPIWYGRRRSVSSTNLPLLWLASTSRSEEHTSELQSLTNLVCRLLLEKNRRRQASPRCAHTGRRAARVRQSGPSLPPPPESPGAAAATRWNRPARIFFNDTATTEIYTLSLHDALPI